jgi:ketosteroid isomerase-like protein
MSQEHLRAYAAAYEALREDNLDALGSLMADDVEFVDPFNQLQGRSRVLAVFEHMFRTVDNAHFGVMDYAVGDNASYLRWRMTGSTRGKGTAIDLHGMSEVHLDDQGRVVRHIDHWDSLSQLFAKLPVFGWIARKIISALAVR